MVPDHIDDHIVALAALGEILLGVIDHLICADGSDHFHIPGTADAGHLCAHRLGDLHRKGPHASRCAVDQDPLPRLDLSMVTEGLQCRERRNGYGSGLLERHVRGLLDQSSLGSSHILGEGPGPPAEYIVPWLELRYVFAHRFHRSRKINS